jgi:hypothetical protein
MQTELHAPQLFRSLLTSCSQPSVCLLPLQSANPTSHTPGSHEAPMQAGVTCEVLQTIPHPPQLMTSVAVFLSHPSVCLLLLQSAKGIAHVPLHMPPPQVRLAMPLLEHTVGHAPQ